LKGILKIQLSYTDIFLILVNLVPLWGVWFRYWNPKEVFLVYCLESVIVGAYNVLMLWLTTLVKKKDLWENGNASTMVSGYLFIFFFIAHYGFFLFLQVGMFLSIAHIGNLGFTDFFTFIFHVRTYLSEETEQLLLLFIAINGIIVLKDFVMPGLYKTASLGTLMFAPYARVFVQQFCVIIGGFLLTFNMGKIFILVFVLVKIFFEIVINYQKLIEDSVNKSSEKQPV
jgi:hypothetical protein